MDSHLPTVMTVGNSPMTANDVLPARGPSVEDLDALEETRRQAEDVEWSTQPLSSMDHGERVVNPHSFEANVSDHRGDSHADQDIRNGTSPAPAALSSQQSPTKISLLTRPIAVLEDPAAGFSFSKVQPMQPLVFGRKSTVNTASVELPPPSLSIANRSLSHSSPPNQLSDSRTTIHSGFTAHQSQAPVTRVLRTVPIPNVNLSTSREYEHSAPNAAGSPLSNHQTLFQSPQDEHTSPATNTPVGSEIYPVNGTHTQDDRVEGPNIPCPESLSSNHAHVAASPQFPQETSLKPTHEPSPLSGSQHHQLPKVTKTRRKKQTGSNRIMPPQSSNGTGLATEEDVWKLLFLKRQQGNQERDMLRAAYQEKEVELRKLSQVSEDIYAQLQEMLQRYSEKEAQLSKIRAAKPGWEAKIKKLTDYVKGLTNDHNRLRDDAKHIRERQTFVLKVNESLFDTIRDVYQSAEQGYTKSNRLINEAHNDIKILGDTVRHQQTQLQGEEALVVSERERNVRLEAQISAFTANHAQLLTLFAGHRETVIEKMNHLLNKVEQFQVTASPASQDHLQLMLDQCIALLKQLPKTVGVKTEDLDRITEFIRANLEDVTRSIEACGRSATATEAGHQQLALSMQDQLQALNVNIITEHTLSEQINDLREVKAEVRGRLQAAETALRDARLEAVTLKQKDAEQSRRIITLESEMLRPHQPIQDAGTLLRLQEVDSHNKDLRQDLAVRTTEATTLGEQVRSKDDELEKLQGHWAHTQRELEEARREIAKLQEEKVNGERQAIEDREEMRGQLSRTAKLQLDNMKSAHLNAMQQLKIQKSPVEKKYNEVSTQLKIMRNEKERIEKEVTETRTCLANVQKEKQDEAASASSLRLRVLELEKQIQEKKFSYQSVQQLLQESNADIRAKDDYIKHINAAFSPSALVSKPVRPPSNHLTVVVKDSQPTENQVLAGMNHSAGDPFLGAREASQDLAGTDEDLFALFPETPRSQRQSVKVPHISVASKAVPREKVSPRGVQPAKRIVSREDSSLPQTQASILVNRDIHPDSSIRRTEHGFTAPKHGPLKASLKVTQTQRLSQESKISTQGGRKAPDSRGEKRGAADSGTGERKRRKPSMLDDLGPVIADSQSPVPPALPRVRGKSQSAKAVNPKGDKYMQRFTEAR